MEVAMVRCPCRHMVYWEERIRIGFTAATQKPSGPGQYNFLKDPSAPPVRVRHELYDWRPEGLRGRVQVQVLEKLFQDGSGSVDPLEVLNDTWIAAEPDENFHSTCVCPAHPLNLYAFFFVIFLIDADRVNPKIFIREFEPSHLEKLEQAFSNQHLTGIDTYRASFGLITPHIGEAAIWSVSCRLSKFDTDVAGSIVEFRLDFEQT